MAKVGNPNIGEIGKETRFGQPNGNKQSGGGFKGGGKTYRQRVAELMFMNEKELDAYIADKNNPAMVIRAAEALKLVADVKSLSIAADIIESKPVQLIENNYSELPPILKPINLNETDDSSSEDSEPE